MSMQMDQQSQHDTRYTKYGKKKRMGVGTAVNSLAYRKRLFLNKILLAQAQRSIISKWGHETEQFLHSKRHRHLDKVSAYIMRTFLPLIED